MPFINENFLLQSEVARHLYHTYAAQQPILDFHSHLSSKEIAENRRFRNLSEIWIEGDHYKWRAMRANGVAEKYCTGDAEPYEKFLAWARTVPHTLRNPLYHWTHLELLRYFGVDRLLDESSAPEIWKHANAQLASGDLTTQGILKKFRVRAVCTTDDPTDSLEYHEQIRASGLPTRVFPTFRPDRALRTQDPAAFNEWTGKLGASANTEIARLSDFLDALGKRHQYFHDHGGRCSDHGLDWCYAEPCTDRDAEVIFAKARAGKEVSPEEAAKFSSYVMLHVGRLNAEKGWTMQLHLGAYRNASTRMFRALGRDTGFDCMADWPQAAPAIAFLDMLDRDNKLPKTILFNVNPKENYAFACLIGSFQDGKIAGKVQFGSGWWFLDQKEGMEMQLNALSNCGLLSRFVGMVTDSRSFMSFPRHEYFRRVLCNLVGSDVEAGLLPDDEQLVGDMIRRIAFDNAFEYFGLPAVEGRSEAPAAHAQASRK
jgi:glucuronate isomerase